MTETLGLVLADDHVVFLDAVTAVLTQLGYDVLAAATSCAGLVDRVKAYRPELCLTDVRFSDGPTVPEIDRLLQASPGTRIVILTADEDWQTMRQALDAGACGYVQKTRGMRVLVDALHRVAAGEVVVEGSFLRHNTPDAPEPDHLQRLAKYLTVRETQCLQLLAAGLDTAAMARRMGVSRTTVRTHVQAVLTKLGVHSRLEAASLAIRHGLVTDLPGRAADAS